MSFGRSLALAAFGSLLVACRAIAGVDSDLAYVPDATAEHADAKADAPPSDGGTPTCPTTKPTVLFKTANQLGPLMLGGSYVYAEVVSQSGEGNLYSGIIGCPKTGCQDGAPETIADYSDAGGPVVFGGATVAASNLYYALSSGYDLGDDDGGLDAGVDASLDARADVVAEDDAGSEGDAEREPTAGSIDTADFDGGSVKAITKRLGYPLFVATSGSSLFWLDDPQTLSDEELSSSWRVFHCDLPDCATPELFMQGAAEETYALFVDSLNVYVVGGDDSNEGAGIYACRTTGGCNTVPEAILTDVDSPVGGSGPGSLVGDPLAGGDTFTSDGTYLYWASYDTGKVLRVVPSTHVTTSIASDQMAPANITHDATYLYWDTADGIIYRARMDGTGQIEPVVCGLSQLAGLAVDDTSVYFTVGDPSDLTRTELVSAPLP